MKDILNKDALERLLRRNWSDFIDKNHLIAFVLQQIRDSQLPESLGDTAMRVTHGFKLTLSRFELGRDGILLWIDFSIPVTGQKTNVGTCEAIVSYDGAIQPLNLVGQTLKMG